MIGHIPRSSRIFIGLLIITLLLTYIAMTLAFNQNRMMMRYANQPFQRVTHEPKSKPNILSTEGWKSFSDKDRNLSFLYPQTWSVKTSDTNKAFYVVTLDVPNTQADINFYISKTGFMGLDGLTEKPYVVNNVQGFMAADNLVGIKTGEYYYTFDGTLNIPARDEFSTILSTVKFSPAASATAASAKPTTAKPAPVLK